MVGSNWQSGSVPTAGLTPGTPLEFGAASNYNITDRPGVPGGTIVDYGVWTFLSSAAQNYTITGGAGRVGSGGAAGAPGIIVQGSATATNHTIDGRVRLDGRSINVMSTSTSLTVNATDGGVVKEGVGTLIITGTMVNPPVIQVSAGTIDFRASQATGTIRFSGTNSSAVVTNTILGAANTRTLTFGNDFSGTSASYAGQVTGNLNLINGRTTANSGVTQVFSGANTYTGTTTINTGAFIVNGTHTGGGNYTVAARTTAPGSGSFAGGTLGGIGTIVLGSASNSFSFVGNAADRVAILRPGASDTDTGTFTLGSASTATTVTLGSFSQMVVDINASAAGLSDRVAIFGNLNIGTNTALVLNSIGGTSWSAPSYTIATFTGTLTGTFSNIIGLDPNYQINYGSNAITLTAIPEPSSFAALAGLGMLGFAATRRRRR